MLVVSRKTGEEVVMPDLGIVFTILEVRGDKVRVGISAPPEIPVFRRELWERIQSGGPVSGASVLVTDGRGTRPAKNGNGQHS
jgi:carbon storage regulator